MPAQINILIGRAFHLYTQYQQLGKIDDLDEAIVLGGEALSLCPPGHSSRAMSLNNLACSLSSRYEQLGTINDLDEALVLDRKALSLRPPGHLGRASSLCNLANNLSLRYRHLGDIDDLNEALVFDREALLLPLPGHLDRASLLNNLAGHLFSRYRQLGDIDDLNEAVVLDREALSLYPPGHPSRASSLNNLASYLTSRYQQLGGTDDLNEALVLDREALSLCPPGHFGRSSPLNNLANHLHLRYQQLGAIDDLDEALLLDREALSLRPPGHPDRSSSLHNLANHLFSRYEQIGANDDLNEALVLDREALSLRPPGHPNRASPLHNLAVYLTSRYEQLGGIDDLNEALVLGYEALSLYLPGHPHHSGTLLRLAWLHYTQFVRLGKTQDEQALFGLFAQLEHVSRTVFTDDLLLAQTWVDAAEGFKHSSALLAHETALRLLVEHMAALPPLPQHLTFLKSHSSSLAVDAFSASLRHRSPIKAVELLEQGRAVFWSQLIRLQSPLDLVIASGPPGETLADEYTRLTSLIRNVLHLPGADQHDRISRLNLELQKVVSEIRKLPGHSRFLLPPLFSDLQRAASGGPVIIVNASHYSCDALVVFVDKDPVHIALPVTKDFVQGWSSKLRALRTLATLWRMDITMALKHLLRDLWDGVVSHVVDILRAMCPYRSRIWWCPTAEFSLLPLHAAAPYRNGQEGLPDLYISSYTTTLGALIRARRADTPNSERAKKCFVAIGQAEAPGFSKLPSIRTELANIKQHVKAVTTFTRMQGKDAHVSGVADKLSQNECVHFACHGYADQEKPFESAFALRDGMFTIQRIIQSNLKNPEFAYLSACHTSVGDQEHPDEVIHLASAIQFSGFRSVIGTMWSVADSPATKVASMFYKMMVDDSGGLDYTRAAVALWRALRAVDIPLDQRILYIHLGA